MDELMEDNQWYNIQDPVKQMITSITKAVRTQSAGIRDLDRKIGFLASTESTQALVESAFSKCFTKQDAAFLVDNVNRKANLEDVSTMETNLMQVTRQLSRLNEVIQEQNSTIRELNHRVTQLQEEVEDVRNPNFQQIFTYIDKQVMKVATEMKERLAEKAETRDVERLIPQKVDEVYRNILSQMNSLNKDLGRTVTKDEFHQLLAAKADNSEVRNLITDVSNCISKQDMHTTLQQQIRPLISSLSSLEKVIQIQEDRRENSPLNSNQGSGRHTSSVQWTYDKIQTVVEDSLIQKYPQLNDMVTAVTLENLMIQQREYLLNELNQQNNQLRRETELTEREFLLSIKKKYEERFQEINGGVREVKDMALHNQSHLKDLTTSVAKMISKKVDRADISRLLQEYSNGIIMDPTSTPSSSSSSSRHPSKGSQGSRPHRHTSPSSSSIFQEHGQGSSRSNSLSPRRRTDGKRNLTLKSNYRRNRPGSRRDPDDLDQEGEDEDEEGRDYEVEEEENAKRHLTKVLNHFKTFQKEHQVLLEKVEGSQEEIKHFREEILQEVALLKKRGSANLDEQSSLSRRGTSGRGGDQGSRVISPSSSMYTDWRIALGELSLNLRREMSEKCGREEMRSAIGIELNLLEKKMKSLAEEVSKKGTIEEMSQVENTVIDLRSKVAGELTGGRWLWTNGKIGKDGWIAWDTEVQNAAPGILLWRKGSTQITTRIPGLYRICGAVFTSLPSALQICLNGEPILSLQPDVSDPSTNSNAQALREERYVIRRMRHSVGEVTCLSIEEHVSLPADAQLTMRFHSSSPAQAFFSIKKL